MDKKLSLKCLHAVLRSTKLIFTFLILGRRDHIIIFICMHGLLLICHNYIKSLFKRPQETLHKISLKKHAKLTLSHLVSTQKVLPDFTGKKL